MLRKCYEWIYLWIAVGVNKKNFTECKVFIELNNI